MPSRLVSNWGQTTSHTHGRQCLCCVLGHLRKPVRARKGAAHHRQREDSSHACGEPQAQTRNRLKMHCPAVQNIRSSESNQARCTIAHRVQRKAYLLLRRPVPFGRDASDSTAIRPAAAAVLAAVSCTTTGALATSKMACSLLQGLRRPGNSSVHAAAGSSFPDAGGSFATRGRRLSAATGREAALRCHKCFPASDLRPGL